MESAQVVPVFMEFIMYPHLRTSEVQCGVQVRTTDSRSGLPGVES